jgi:ABC-2 type transport system ATP-binding protein
MTESLAVSADALGRVYKLRDKGSRGRTRVALEGVSLEIRRGELFGLLGPNGAGKTTLIKILTTLLAPSSGSAHVAGYDVTSDPQAVRARINMVSGGEASGYGLLTVRENLWMFSQFYGLQSAEANRRIVALLEMVKMSDRLHTKSALLSTGLRQKMNIVRGFLTDPEVLFLDEPTLGLDVGASRDVRAFVRRWVEEDRRRTVLVTTHYMAEADELCDRVAIINQGRLLACDTPAALKRRLPRAAIFQLETTPLTAGALAACRAFAGVTQVTERASDGRTELELRLDEERVIGAVIGQLNAHGAELLTLTKREPSLEDVFVDLVGRSMEEVERVAAPEAP